jgi:hypothetical protein
MVIVAATCGNLGTYTLNNGFTQGTHESANSSTGVTGYKSATGSSETPSVTHNSVNRQALIGFIVQAAPPDPNKATNPDPANGASGVLVSAGLSWDAPAAYTPTSYDVYFGTNPSAHSNPKYTVYTNSYEPPSDLAEGTTYYWAVDSNDSGTIYPGDDWSFTTLGQVDVGQSLKIDFTQMGNPVQAGYEGYFATQEVLSSFTTQSYSVFGTTVYITPTWVPGAVDTAAQMYDRGGDDGTDAEDLLRDWIGTDAREVGDPMTLTVEGLPAGNYIWKSYHHDTHDQTGLFDVTVNDAAGSVETIGIDISSTQYDGITHLADVTKLCSYITSNGTDPITLVFDCQNSSGDVSTVFFVMNGFELFKSSKAICPVPADGASDVSVSADLSWLGPTEYTPTSYDVYFGTNPDAHSNPKCTVYTNSYDPPNDLARETTYYWAVDSNDSGTIYDGNDWSFTTILPVEAGDYVSGNMMLINDNAGWCWYQDEKIIYDPVDGSVITSTSAQSHGLDDGSGRGNDVDATTFNIATGKRTRVKACDRGGDDHNMGALWIRPDGRYLHIYTGHNANDNSYYRTTINPNDGSSWSDELYYNWVDLSGLEDDTNITYSNVLYLSAEGSGSGRLYNITRGFGRNPQISYSDDWGVTWHYGGRLSVPSGSSSYSNGYYKFNSNGVDRIDFIATEHHPRDYNNSIYHGYIKGGKSYNSYGEVVDSNIFDQNSPVPEDFTPVFLAGPVAAGEYHTAWTAELELDENGYPVCLFTTRYGTGSYGGATGAADHRLFYGRFDGSAWNTTELAKMGTGLHTPEQDYTGIGCIHPNDANLIYISTNFDPCTDVSVGKHEIFKGVTYDNGENWDWTQITSDSTVDNLRPAIPKWDANNTAVFWLRGYYPYSLSGGAPQSNFDEVLVGMVDREDEKIGRVIYFDAGTNNTINADGNAFSPTGPSGSAGAADNQWHEYTGYGNGGSCYVAGDGGTENAPAIKTTISGFADGTYDVFAYFWCHPAYDWGIRGGFTPSDMLNFNKQSSQHAQASQFSGTVEVADDEAILYRVYIGRRNISGGASIDVYIDDYDSSFSNRPTRTTYDGIGVAKVVMGTIPGDLNQDGRVDLRDIAVLGQGWLTIYSTATLANVAENWLFGI